MSVKLYNMFHISFLASHISSQTLQNFALNLVSMLQDSLLKFPWHVKCHDKKQLSAKAWVKTSVGIIMCLYVVWNSALVWILSKVQNYQNTKKQDLPFKTYTTIRCA